MELVLDKTITFVPEFNGNKDLPAAEQILVEIENPTIALKSKVRRPAVATARTDRDGRMDGMEIKLETDDKTAVIAMVTKISGCSYRIGNDQKFITNGRDLSVAPVDFAPLLDEVTAKCNEILDRKIDEKN